MILHSQRSLCLTLPACVPPPPAPRPLQMLETHQRGVHEALVGMEGEAERLYREERPLLDDDSK